MNYTENYQLPQWVETDRIMMEDFNEAMAKVDQGIGALQYAKLLQNISVSEPTQNIRISLENTPWQEYNRIILRPNLLTTVNYNVDLYFNNRKTAESVMTCHGDSASLSNSYAVIHTHPTNYYQPSTFNEIIFDLTHDTVICSYWYAFSYKNTSESSWVQSTRTGLSVARTLTWAEVTEIDLFCIANILAGSTVQLYGAL